MESSSDSECSKCIQGNSASFHQQRNPQGQKRLCMVEVSWIFMQSCKPIAVYFSIIENSVMYYHTVMTIKLSKVH